MEWKEIISQILAYLLKTGFKRFLSSLILIGASLLGLSWLDVVMNITAPILAEGQEGNGMPWGQIVGLLLISIGVFGRFTIHLISIYSAERKKAASLIGRLRVLVNGFMNSSIKKDAGYFNNEILQCKDAALNFLEVAPKCLSGNQVLASIVNPKFDASKNGPYIDINLAQINDLIEKLGIRYGIK